MIGRATATETEQQPAAEISASRKGFIDNALAVPPILELRH